MASIWRPVALFVAAVLVVLVTPGPSLARRRRGKPQPARVAAPTQRNRISLVAVGDLMLSGTLDGPCRSRGFLFPFEKLAGFTSGADVACANLECPITAQGWPAKSKRWVFRASPEAIQGLRYAGFDVLSLANNHILDYGMPGLEDTRRWVGQAGMQMVGAARTHQQAISPTWLNVGGHRIAFLAYSKVQPPSFFSRPGRGGAATIEVGALREAILKVRGSATHLVVFFHWGAEYRLRPSRFQVALGRAAIESGATMVLGTHSHTWGPVEVYQGRPICYSLGNFIFGTSNPRATVGLAVRADLTSEGLATFALYPLDVAWKSVRGQSDFLGGTRRAAWLDHFRTLCAEYGTQLVEGPDGRGVGVVLREALPQGGAAATAVTSR